MLAELALANGKKRPGTGTCERVSAQAAAATTEPMPAAALHRSLGATRIGNPSTVCGSAVSVDLGDKARREAHARPSLGADTGALLLLLLTPPRDSCQWLGLPKHRNFTVL